MFSKHFQEPDFLLPLWIISIIIGPITFVCFFFILFKNLCSAMSLTSLFQDYYKELFYSYMKFLNLFVLSIMLPISSHTFSFLSSGVRSCSLAFLTLTGRCQGMERQCGREGKEMLISASVSNCTTHSYFPK